jgi:hypothetical protein
MASGVVHGATDAKEWTPYWMQKLKYRFGDDGIFCMSFHDILRDFSNLQRTRLFDKRRTVDTAVGPASTSPGFPGYLNTKSSVDIKKPGLVVFALLQVRQLVFSPHAVSCTTQQKVIPGLQVPL